jgi:methyltransferase
MRLLACGGMAVARLAELAWSRHNIDESGPAVEGGWSRRTYPLIVALHTLVIAGTFLLGSNRPRWGWLLALLAVQPVRLWVLLTLRSRWNTRAAVPVEMEIETGGPYEWVRHPNYAVVAVELAALPLAFGLRGLSTMATVANAALLWPRIREEERALMVHPAYRRHFRDKARFIPGLF